MQLRLDEVRALIFADPRGAAGRALAKACRSWEGDDPNVVLVIGGDGTMLHAIREHWRLRLPFYGINTGHMGFLLNDEPPGDQLPSHSERNEESRAGARHRIGSVP